MRLTLRTMLAYMDEKILDPQDQADIGHKIEESEFATELLHRIRDVMRRLRLGAPQLTGRGMGLDPNTVAEYLDNTLPADRIADFERICLESDVHLAEVGACHQILTLVVTEPAEVNPASREKMYRVPAHSKRLEHARLDGAHPALAREGNGEGETGDKNHKRRTPEVPDYLRESTRSRRRSWALAAVVVLLVGGGLAAALAPPDWWRFANRDVAQQGNGQSANADKSADSGTFAKVVPPADTADTADDPAENDIATADDSRPDASNSNEGQSNDEPSKNGRPDNDLERSGERGVEQPAVDLSEPSVASDEPPLPAEPTIDDSDLTATSPLTPPADDSAPAAIAEPGADATPVAGQVGRYVSDKNVLLRRDKQNRDEWRRLPSRAALLPGDELRALPAFRPSITLNSGVQLELAGGTSLVLLPANAQGVPGVDLKLGRIVLLHIGGAGSQLRLQLGEHQHQVALVDPDSTVAIELRRVLPPGTDPESQPAPIKADIHVASGKVQWEEEGQRFEVAAPAHWRLPGGAADAADKEARLPNWINPEPLSAVERRASAALEAALVLDRPANLAIAEQVGARQFEVRSLATRCAIHTGDFEPFIDALNDDKQRATWSLQIEAMRDVLAGDPAVATQIREAFEQRRGDKGQALYRMLWGYGSDELQTGAAAQLVKDLDHESLDFRVLAFWNLQHITGLGLMYQPEYPAARRKQPVQKWKQRLDEGAIRPGATAAEPSGQAPSSSVVR